MKNQEISQLEGVDIVVEGSGDETILMIHGWPDTLAMWDSQVDALKHEFRCARFTLPGYEPHHERKVRTLDEMVEFIDKVVNLISPDAPIILLVHDWGCLFGYQYYNCYPDRVSKVIGIDIGDSITWKENVPFLHQFAANAYQAILAASWKVGGRIGDISTRNVARFFKYPGPIENVGAHMNYPYVAFHFIGGDSYKNNITKFVPDCPFLFVYGAKGPIMPFDPKWADEIAKKEGNKVIPFETEHWVSVEQPERFNEEVLAWLRSLRSLRS